MKRYRRLMVLSLLAAFILPAAASAQQELAQRCANIPVDPTRRFCNLVAQAIETGQPRIGLVLAGGNPLSGAASTLGMRIGKLPRFSAAARITGAKLDVPDIQDFNGSGDLDAFLPALSVDASVGLLTGFDIMPTVGGFLSVDLVASIGTVAIPEDDGFETGRVNSWAAGARIGLLRESFTVPGLSVTAMYRAFNDVSFGSRQLTSDDAYYESSNFHAWSLRGVVGKRIVSVGASAGLGYDRYSSDVAFGVSNPGVVPPARFDLREDGFTTSRTSAFGSAHWTLLIVSVVGELGWQFGGESLAAPLPAGRSGRDSGAFFGTLAVRVSI
ncbi:MAG: hypothetical protein ACREMA_03655 [Longimicrobiales bacterium]